MLFFNCDTAQLYKNYLRNPLIPTRGEWRVFEVDQSFDQHTADRSRCDVYQRLGLLLQFPHRRMRQQPNQFWEEEETIDMGDTIQFWETGKSSSNRFQFPTTKDALKSTLNIILWLTLTRANKLLEGCWMKKKDRTSSGSLLSLLTGRANMIGQLMLAPRSPPVKLMFSSSYGSSKMSSGSCCAHSSPDCYKMSLLTVAI